MNPDVQNVIMLGGLLGLGGYSLKKANDKVMSKGFQKKNPDTYSFIKNLEDKFKAFFPSKLSRKDAANKKEAKNTGISPPGKDTPSFDTQLNNGESGLVQ